MKIVADENIPYLQECFGQSAEVVALNGRYITNADLQDANALIVRSVTPVTRKLLANTPIRFVGSCTIGIDHVDTDYLDERGISFSSAPGSNADSAAQYTLNAIFALLERQSLELRNTVIGIIGYGNVGQRLKRLLDALEARTIIYDPLLSERGKKGLSPLDKVLEADIISFHVPLTHTGKYPTYRMVNADMLGRLKPSASIINCARGDIINSSDLIKDIALHARHVALDVWPNEPQIDEHLLSLVQIATPHIAGYSLDGKLRGTSMVYEAYCKAMNQEFQPVTLELPAPEPISVSDDSDPFKVVKTAVRHSYDILQDDSSLREILDEERSQQGAFFDRLRKNYPVRREYSAYTCYGGNTLLNSYLKSLGFAINE